MQKRNLIAPMIVAACVVALIVWQRRHPDTPPAPPERPSQSAPAATKASAPPSTGKPASRVRRLGREERKQLGERITESLRRTHQRTSGATQPGSPPALADVPILSLDDVVVQVKDALVDAVPLVAECYERLPPDQRKAAARMTMISDPDLGTVVDTKVITDGTGKPVEPSLDDCMRDVIDSLALPTLGQPGQLEVEFTFSDD